MIKSQNLIDKICAKIAEGGLTALETCQATNALEFLSTNVVTQVGTVAALPDAVTYVGRMVFVNDENRYYHSTGINWIQDFSSAVFNYADVAWSWGCSSSGRLGDGTTVNKSSPVSVVGGFIDWSQVDAGPGHSLGVRTNGTAWAWGSGADGRLGDGTTVDKSSPVSVLGGFTDWCQVSAGSNHSLGVRTNGTAWGWGAGFAGKNGDGTATDRSSPVSVVGGFADWCQVSAGTFHSLGVRCNGSAWAWGLNSSGQLGDGTVSNRSSPVSVVGGFCDWCQVSAGGYHSLGVRTNGTAWAWGRGACGRLGDDTTVNKSSPVSVIGGFVDWCQVSASGYHSLGVRTNGSAWAWGLGSNGRLGDGTTVDKSSPVSIIGGFTDWCQVSAGTHSLGIRTNGTAWAWGDGVSGRLGDGTATNRSSPVSVIGGFCDWCQVSAGDGHSLGVRQLCKGF